MWSSISRLRLGTPLIAYPPPRSRFLSRQPSHHSLGTFHTGSFPGVVTSAGSLGILIPPSIPMLVYALVKMTRPVIDPKELFLAGVGPGILLGLMLGIYAMGYGIVSKTPRVPFSLHNLFTSLRDGFWAMMLPVMMLILKVLLGAAFYLLYLWLFDRENFYEFKKLRTQTHEYQIN